MLKQKSKNFYRNQTTRQEGEEGRMFAEKGRGKVARGLLKFVDDDGKVSAEQVRNE
jgi:hypothetical protein